MAKIADGTFRDWQDTEVINASEYKQEREILRTAVNDNNDRVKTIEGHTLNTRTNSLEGRMTTAESDISNRYTKTEANSLLANKTDKNGDHPGTWQGLTPSQASEAVNGGRIDFMETAKKEQSTLNNGENIINSVSKWKSSINVLATVGKTSIVDGSGIHGVVNPTIESNGKRMVIPTTLHGMNGVQDEVFVDVDGKLKKRSNFKELILDGSLPWTHNTNLTGFKQVMLNSSGLFPGVDTADKFTVSKYDGTILQDGIDAFDRSVADKAQIHSSNKQLYITISDNDSGWGSEYIPTNDEVKAYFYGWRMYEFSKDTLVPYTTGTKAWAKMDGTSGGVTTLPTTLADWYIPYKIVHQLETSAIEEINTFGQAVLNDGENTVTVKQGVIVRERAQVVVDAGNAQINNAYNSTTMPSVLNYKVGKILNIYKDEYIDTHNWVIRTDGNPYGLERASMDDAIANGFDTGATYYVDYEILPELTVPSEPITIEYANSLKSIVDNHTQQLSEHEWRLDNFPDFIKNDSGIVETGSNSNGIYVRFANGMQICYGYTHPSSLSSLSIANNTEYSSPLIPFASKFSSDKMSLFISAFPTNSTGARLYVPIFNDQPTGTFSTTEFYKFSLKNTSGVTITRIVGVTYTAIGWWK